MCAMPSYRNTRTHNRNCVFRLSAGRVNAHRFDLGRQPSAPALTNTWYQLGFAGWQFGSVGPDQRLASWQQWLSGLLGIGSRLHGRGFQPRSANSSRLTYKIGEEVGIAGRVVLLAVGAVSVRSGEHAVAHVNNGGVANGVDAFDNCLQDLGVQHVRQR